MGMSCNLKHGVQYWLIPLSRQAVAQSLEELLSPGMLFSISRVDSQGDSVQELYLLMECA
jgi:hypothetical protein